MKNPLHIIAKALSHIGHRRSPRWPAVRAAYLKDHPACAACGSTKNVELHHVIPFSVNASRELDPTNFLPLCERMFRQHHLKVGHSFAGKRGWKYWNPNVVEDARAMMEKTK